MTKTPQSYYQQPQYTLSTPTATAIAMSVALSFNCGFARVAVKELTGDRAQEFQNLFPTASIQIPKG